MQKSSKEWWLTLGSTLVVVGTSAVVALFVAAETSNRSFWGWPGILSLILTGAGILCIAKSVLARDGSRLVNQRQVGGEKSVNYQVGRGIRFENHGGGDG